MQHIKIDGRRPLTNFWSFLNFFKKCILVRYAWTSRKRLSVYVNSTLSIFCNLKSLQLFSKSVGKTWLHHENFCHTVVMLCFFFAFLMEELFPMQEVGGQPHCVQVDNYSPLGFTFHVVIFMSTSQWSDIANSRTKTVYSSSHPSQIN